MRAFIELGPCFFLQWQLNNVELCSGFLNCHSYTKNFINNEWYLYDDDDILHIKSEDLESKIVTSQAYLLFYKKRDNFLINKVTLKNLKLKR